MNTIELLINRNSHAKLTAPAPSEDELATLFAAAMRAPDHGLLRPWRFMVVQNTGLDKLAVLFVASQLAIEPELLPAKKEKLLAMPHRAPMIIIAVSKFIDNVKIPQLEQQLATGAAITNLQLAADALGYSSIWRTGELATNPHLIKQLGLSEQDSILGFIYLGTAEGEKKSLKPLTWQEYVTVFE